MSKTFRERFLMGEAPFDEIFDLTDEWGFSDVTTPLREYLGLTVREEEIWVDESDEALEDYMNRERSRKVLFTDLDGTLLHDDKSLSEPMREALRAVSAAGHPIVIATGRFTPSALRQFEKLKIDSEACYLITCNGAEIYDISAGEVIARTCIDKDLVRLCFDEAKAYGIHIQAYGKTNVISEADTPELREYCSLQQIPFTVTEDVLSCLDEDSPKLLASKNDDPDCVRGFYEVLKEKAGDRLDFFFSNPLYLEIVAPGTNKGNAIAPLCEHLCIPGERSVAAGDAENDISMIRAAGTGIAMANATPAVKEEADLITEKDNNHDGLLPLLKNIFLDQ